MGQPNDQPLIGSLIDGRYRLVRLLGEGGMGQVFLAEHVRIQRPVALKVLRPEFSSKNEIAERFLREAVSTSRVAHPNVVEVFDFGQLETGQFYLTMEFLEGHDLATELVDHQVLAPSRCLPIALQVCSGLAAAHAQGVVHRDLKPENVFLQSRGDGEELVRIVDFGIAQLQYERETSDGRRLTRTGAIFGTPEYMAPEQASGHRGDHRMDIYALAVILYQVLTGSVPFSGETFMAVLTKHMVEAPQPLRARHPGLLISDELERVVLRGLAKSPDERFASMLEFATALQATPEGKDLPGTLRLPAAHAPLVAQAQKASVTQVSDVAFPTWSPPDSPENKSTWFGRLFSRRDTSAPIAWDVSNKPSSPPKEAPARGPETESASVASLRRCLPLEIQAHAQAIWGFLNTIFGQIKHLKSGVVSLHEARAPHAAKCEYFAVFMGITDGVMGPQTLVASIKPLEDHLKSLGHDRRKMVIAVSHAVDHRTGVATKIVDYMHEYNARVVPLNVREILGAYTANESLALFRERLAEYELPNLFETKGDLALTSLVGLKDRATSFAMEMKTPGAMLAVYGLPGSGKSSLLRKVSAGVLDHSFIAIRCMNLKRRSFPCLAREITDKLAGKEFVAAEPDARADELIELCAASLDQRHGPAAVLVLDDADWAIEALTSADGQVRLEAQRFWEALARLAERTGLRVIVSGVRAFMLEYAKISDWPNQLAKAGMRAWPVPFLDEHGVHALVQRLSEQMDAEFEIGALAQVARHSGGHIGVLRQICAEAISACRVKHRDQMATLHVREEDVRSAVERLAASAPTFRNRLSGWYSELENRVLVVIATQNVRNVAQLREALSSYDPEAVSEAFERTQETKIIGFDEERFRLRIPLLESWLKRHVGRDPNEGKRKRQRAIAIISVGTTISTILVGVYVFATAAQTALCAPARVNDCVYEVTHPTVARVNQPFQIGVARRNCSGPVQPGQITVHGTDATRLAQGGPIELKLTGNASYASGVTDVIAATGTLFNFSLAVESDAVHVASFDVTRNFPAELAGGSKAVLALALALPAALSLFVALNRQMFAALNRGFQYFSELFGGRR